jgi:crotonobetainyl-CoA:carnitine CoA-transferase CaiB-like acyl-CoA transferase
MTLALEGIRVVDLARGIAGPTTSMYLGDQGAEVIKIEPPPDGDPSRSGRDASPFLQGNGLGFMVKNRNKKSLLLDIRKAEGRDVLLKLLQTSDVVVVNFREAAGKRLGLDYASLHERNPRLIYASVSGYGTKGPHAQRGGYDRVIQGFAGVMYRHMPDGTPITAGLYAADTATPMLLSYGIMCALWSREKTGVGQKVEGSLLQTWLALQLNVLQRADDDPAPVEEPEERLYLMYRCSDGKYINICPNNRGQITRTCKALDLGEILADPRMDDPNGLQEIRDEVLHPTLVELLATRPSQYWLDLLYEADVPCGPILSRREVFEEPQALANEMLTTVQHPKAGRTTMVGVPVRLSETPGAIQRPAPLLGADTDEILTNLGYGAGEIGHLQDLGVV